MYSEFAE